MTFQEKLTALNHRLGVNITLTNNQILTFKIDEFTPTSIRAWSQAVEELADESTLINKRIYDLRTITNFPLAAIRAATRIRQNPTVHLRYVVVLVKSEKVRGLVDLILKIQPGGRVRVMGDEAEAIVWLNEQIKSPLL